MIPADKSLVRGLSERIEHVAAGLLLPIFFALTGLRTSITLVRGLAMWFYCALILTVAVAGKLGGSCPRIPTMSQ